MTVTQIAVVVQHQMQEALCTVTGIHQQILRISRRLFVYQAIVASSFCQVKTACSLVTHAVASYAIGIEHALLNSIEHTHIQRTYIQTNGVVGQFIEGNFLTPKLVGDSVGLHPVWVMFALLAGGVLLGFLGLMIAVPTAAVIGVLVRFAIGKYKKSSLYKN